MPNESTPLPGSSTPESETTSKENLSGPEPSDPSLPPDFRVPDWLAPRTDLPSHWGFASGSGRHLILTSESPESNSETPST